MKRQLIQEKLPLGIIICHAYHIGKLDAVILLNGKIRIGRCIVGGNKSVVFDDGLHFGSQLHILDRSREGVPVSTGQISHCAGQPAVQIHGFKQVGNDIAGLAGYGVGRIVPCIQLDRAGQRSITGHGITGSISQRSSGLSQRQHIVQRIVRIAADSEGVFTRIEHIAALAGGISAILRVHIICSKQVIIRNDGHFFARRA